jgi:hypothetical protein
MERSSRLIHLTTITSATPTFDCAARLAAIPAGESPANRRSPVTVVVISSNGEGDRSVESLEVKAPEGWGVPVRSVQGASNLAGRSGSEPAKPRNRRPAWNGLREATVFGFMAPPFHAAAAGCWSRSPNRADSPRRLDRDLRHRFGERAYAAEELVAELAAATACARAQAATCVLSNGLAHGTPRHKNAQRS